MLFISVLLIISSLLVLGFLINYYSNTRYNDFVIKNSKAIKDMMINSNYRYKEVRNPIWIHTYDNEKMYDNVSCYDYLVYQLQSITTRNSLLNVINCINDNQSLFKEYIRNINALEYGIYKEEPIKLNKDKLIRIEKEIVRNSIKKPLIKFQLVVTLDYVNMGGKHISRKRGTFSEYNVCHIIDLSNDKNGRFYNNRDIWDSICRIERSKVSNRIRFSIYERDNYRCQICHRRFAPEQLDIDHIYPISKGGKTTIDNLQTLCKRCNKENGIGLFRVIS